MIVGVIGPAGDAEVQELAARLESRGVEPWIVDLTEFPERLRITFSGPEVLVDGRPLGEMDAAYLRRVGTALPDHATYRGRAVDAARWDRLYDDTLRRYRAERANIAVRTAALEHLARRRPVINPPVPQNLHRLKVFELDRLRRCGMVVPALQAGSASAPMCAFAREAGARWAGAVDKPLAGIYKTHLWTEERGTNHRWGRRPALYQRYVPGDTIRCYVLDGELLAAARIVHGGTVDSSMSQTGIEVIEPDGAGREAAQGTARALGLAFCGLDLMRDESGGEHFVIDCNLSPMFVSFGRLSRCDIAGHLADHLIACAASRRPVRRPDVLEIMADAKQVLAQDPEIARLLWGKRMGTD